MYIKRNSSFLSNVVRTLLATTVACIVSFLIVGFAWADPWNYCGTEGRSCRIPDNPSSGVTVRYGASGVYSYKYSVTGNSIPCTNSVFGDPKPGASKRCYFSYKAEPRNGSPQALHSVFMDPSSETHEEFLAHTLDENEIIRSPNGEYWLKLLSNGKLELRKVSGTGRGVKWSTQGDSNYRSSDLYRLHVLPKGLEVRKNGRVIWSQYPRGTSVLKNYILHITNSGELRLDDMESRIRRWSVKPNQSPSFAQETLSHALLVENWAKMGWHHTAQWTASEVDKFRIEFNNLSHFDIHVFLDGAEKLGGYKASSIVDVINRLNFSENITNSVEAIFNSKQVLKKAKDGWRLVRGLSDLAEDLITEKANIAGLLGPAIDSVQNSENDEQREMVSYLEGMGNRELSAPEDVNESVAPCRSICQWLSRDHNSDKRLDYAIEFAPTLLNDAFLKGGAQVSSGWLDQLQLRAFFTHPRLNGDGRFYTEIRIRILDLSGVYIEESVIQDFLGLTGIVSVHDFILPYSWSAENETFVNDRKFEGLKYLALEGVLAELDVEAGKLVSEGVQAVFANHGGYERMRDTLNMDNESIHAMSDAESLLTKFKKRWGNPAGMEFGVGIGMYAYYDINEMAKLRGGNSTARVIRNLSSVIGAEALGSFGVIAAMSLTGVLEEAFAVGLESGGKLDPLAVTNAGVIAGGALGDIAYTRIWRRIHEDAGAISMGGDGFVYAAVKIPLLSQTFNLDASKIGLPAFGAPLRTRLQINYDFHVKEWWGDNSPPKDVDEYGVYQLKTKHNKCVEVQRNVNINDAETKQTNCRQNDLHQLWQFNKTGSGDYYEIRNMDNGYCLSVPPNNSGSLSRGTRTVQTLCDTPQDPSVVRWKAINVGNNKIMLRSAYDDSKCFDLSGGGSGDQTPMHLWSCDINNANQHFEPEAESSIIAGSHHAIITLDGKCLDNKANIFNPANGTLVNQQDCNKENRQDWVINYKGSGYYDIRMKGTSKCMTVKSASTANNADIVMANCSGATNQQWEPFITGAAGNRLIFEARHSKKCMQLLRDGTYNGKLVQNKCNTGEPTQDFQVVYHLFEGQGGLDPNPGRGFRRTEENSVEKANFVASKQRPGTWDNNIALAGPQKAYDGIKDGIWGNQGVTHTKSPRTYGASWQGDLGISKEVHSITLYNRTDCCGDRLNDFYILVSDQNMDGMSLSASRGVANAEIYATGVPVPSSKEENSRNYYFPEGTVGRYIKIQFNKSEHLHLAEVMAFVREGGGQGGGSKASKPVTGVTSNSVTHSWKTINLSGLNEPPVMIAQMQTFDGADTATVKMKNLRTGSFETKVGEENLKDSELRHTTESIGYMGFNEGPILDIKGNIVGEAIKLENVIERNSYTYYRSSASRAYGVGDYVVIGAGNDTPAGEALGFFSANKFPRLLTSNVLFRYGYEEWDDNSFRTVAHRASVIVFEKGTHELANGYTVWAGDVANVNHNFKSISFPFAFSQKPAVFTQRADVTGGADNLPPVVSRMRNVTNSGFQVRFQEAESENGTRDSNQISVIAIGKR